MELKELQGQLQTAFEELKAAGEKQANEIKAFGATSQETKSVLDRINSDMNELKGRIDSAETKLNRTAFNGGGEPNQENNEKKAAFFKFMREGKSGLSPEERKALVEDGTGQIIVPEGLDQEIYRELPKLTVMRGLVSSRQIQTDRIRRRSMNEVTVGWGKLETSVPTLASFESTLTPADDYLYIENVYGLTKVGEDELEDTDVNLQQYISNSFAQAFAEAEDHAFLFGTGHANYQPEGIFNGTTVGRFTSASLGAVNADDLIKLAYEVKAQYAQKGSYLMNSKLELAVRLFKDQNGQYLWQPALTAGAPNAFNGRPVYVQDSINGTVATGNEIAAFGDFKAGYQVLDRNGGAITRINELYIEDGLIGFKYKRRVGGGVVRPNAMKILKVQ